MFKWAPSPHLQICVSPPLLCVQVGSFTTFANLCLSSPFTHTACSSATHSTDICGNFTNECHVSLRYRDVMYDSITFYAASNSFAKVERAYDDADQFCQGAPVFESFISGFYQLLGDSDVINVSVVVLCCILLVCVCVCVLDIC